MKFKRPSNGSFLQNALASQSHFNGSQYFLDDGATTKKKSYIELSSVKYAYSFPLSIGDADDDDDAVLTASACVISGPRLKQSLWMNRFHVEIGLIMVLLLLYYRFRLISVKIVWENEYTTVACLFSEKMCRKLAKEKENVLFSPEVSVLSVLFVHFCFAFIKLVRNRHIFVYSRMRVCASCVFSVQTTIIICCNSQFLSQSKQLYWKEQ